MHSVATASQQLSVWKSEAVEYPDACIHDIITAQAARTPDAAAVVFRDSVLTYSELEREANRLAHYLRGIGVDRGSLVGLSIERSHKMVIALLAILKAGGAYLPLDPAYPDHRLQLILDDSAAKVLLTESSAGSKLATNARVVCLDQEWTNVQAQDPAPLPAISNSSDLAYVLYTSGSTGKPKGVQIEHRNVVNFLCSMQQEPGCAGRDVLVAVTTLSFDIAGLEMYLPLSVGAQVVIASREEATDGTRLIRLMNDSKATLMQATPATWRMLLDAGWKGSSRLKILCGGEAFPPELARSLLPRCSSLWNMYGPTETTIWSSIYKVDRNVPSVLPIGRPIANTHLYILDAERQPVAVGAEGELYIAGDGVARGYFARPQLTAERFLPDPFVNAPGARMYRTGDLVRALPDGNIVYLGRLDNQVKIRGFRIELGEIEAVLAQLSAVHNNVVVARRDQNGEDRLVAYVVSRREATFSADQFRQHVRSCLPEYMVPALFVNMDALPLTPNGKIDRNALPQPDWSNLAIDTADYVAPRNRMEMRLARIWERVLGVRPIGINTDFFSLGMHSLIAARLVMEVSRAFKKDLPVSLLYQAPTVKQLAQFLSSNQNVRWSSVVPIQTAGSKTPVFCVHGGGGGTITLRHLARYLGKDRPFYGLQAEIDGLRATRQTVEQMAAHYAEQIKTVAPNGPYHLAGYCFGGLVALEMARILDRQGEQVGVVGLIGAPNTAVKLTLTNDLTTAESKRPRGVFKRVALALDWRVRRWFQTLPARRARLSKRFLVWYADMGWRLPAAWRTEYLQAITNRAEEEYRPTPYDGTVSVISGAGLFTDPTLGWEGLALDGVRVCPVGGTHRILADVLNEPAVTLTAEVLRQELADAEARLAGVAKDSTTTAR